MVSRILTVAQGNRTIKAPRWPRSRMSVCRSLSSRIHPHDRSCCDANRLSGMRPISCRCCLNSYIMISQMPGVIPPIQPHSSQPLDSNIIRCNRPARYAYGSAWGDLRRSAGRTPLRETGRPVATAVHLQIQNHGVTPPTATGTGAHSGPVGVGWGRRPCGAHGPRSALPAAASRAGPDSGQGPWTEATGA